MPPSQSLRDKTLFITGASRGIGLAIALAAARDGANIVVAAKTVDPHPKLPGTIHTAAAEIENAGGKALAVQCDIRAEDQVLAAMDRAAAAFGGIDILVNNASAISLKGTAETPVKRYDLMHGINGRGTFLCCQAALPFLKKAPNPHILTISPPLDMKAKWFAPHSAYTAAKFVMSMHMLGMAEEFRPDGIACNCLWPRTIIATAALALVPGADLRRARHPAIMADAARAILLRDSRACSGNFFIDDDVLRAAGTTDLSAYAVDPDAVPMTDLFLEEPSAG